MGKGDRKVIIIGAGLTGLRIGQILASAGMQIELIETQPTVGGMLQTVERSYMGDCYMFDLGPHLFFEEYASVYESLLGNGSDDQLTVVKGHFVIKVGDETLLYPLKMMNMLARLPLSLTQRIIWDLARSRLTRKKDGGMSSVREWMTQRFGDTLFDNFFAPYIEKCTGLSPERVSHKWATERTTVTGESLAQTLMKIMTEAFKGRKSHNLASSEQMAAYYPNHGAGRIPLAMAADIERHGGKISLNTRLSNLCLENSMVKSLILTESGNRRKIIHGDIFVSTISLPSLIRLFSAGVPAPISAASKRLAFRQLLLVNIIVDQANILDHLELFYPDKRFPFKRIYEPKRMSPKMAPEMRSSLVLEICCSDREAEDFQLQKRLIDRSIAMLENEGILKREDVLDCFTISLPNAYPIYGLGFEQVIAAIEQFLATVANLITCGRQGLFEYHAMTNESMEIAENVADLILSGKSKADVNAQGKWSKYFY
ncbi:MAG: hypothetical protein QG552_2965 [Thermodesulfobacteriota bacterium]|nr:hypothetical protein [Thermodesulfobacteriota bacterium]